MDLQSSRYIKNQELLEETPPVEPAVLPIVRILEFPETDRGRFVIVCGSVLLLAGFLLANFGALQFLTAHSQEELAANWLAWLLPFDNAPVTRWVVFGVTSVLMASGMAMIGSQTYHPSLLALHVLVPLSVLPVIFGYIYRSSCDRYPMATQMWAGAGAFLAATALVWLGSAMESGQSHLQLFIFAFQLQSALALIFGSLLAFWHQIRTEAAFEKQLAADPSITAA